MREKLTEESPQISKSDKTDNEPKKHFLKRAIKNGIYIFLALLLCISCFITLSIVSYKFKPIPLQLSKLALSRLDTTLNKGLVIGRSSFEGVGKEKIKENIKEIKKRIENKKNEAQNQSKFSDELVGLEKQLAVLEKLLSVEIWFYLDPNKKIQTVSDDANIPLVATWPLDVDVLKKLNKKFDLVVLDPGVFQHIYEEDQFIRDLQNKGVEDFLKHLPVLLEHQKKSSKFLQDIMYILKYSGLFLCDASIKISIGIKEIENNYLSDFKLEKTILSDAKCVLWHQLSSNTSDWVLPHKTIKQTIWGKIWGRVGGIWTGNLCLLAFKKD